MGVKGIIPVSMVDWPGKICATIFMGGCRWRCPWCHNKLIAWHPDSVPSMSREEVESALRSLVISPKDLWMDGVTVSGGEPTDDPETLFWLLNLAKNHFRTKIPVKLDANGSNPDILARVIEGLFVDAIHMDVKAPLETRAYSLKCGVPVDLKAVKASIEMLIEQSVKTDLEVVFRATVAENENAALICRGITNLHNQLKLPVSADGKIPWKFVVQPLIPRSDADIFAEST